MSRDIKESKLIDTDSSSSSSSSIEKPKPILGLELTEKIDLEKYYVGKIREKRNTSIAIKSISNAVPGFGHLKRCNDTRLILSPVANKSVQQLKNDLTLKGFDLSLLEDEFHILELPSKSCRTKQQAETNNKIWPINFHPDQTIESIISGDYFNSKLLSRIYLFMKLTVQATRIESIGNEECNGSVLIVDPSNGESLALASSQHHKNPLWHGSMLAIDLIAKIQGGGSWDLASDEKKPANAIKRKFTVDYPLRYPPKLYEINFPKSEPLEFSLKSSKKNQNQNQDNKFLKKTGPYLCTNYWIFLTQEPCTLCAMALLHSRASNIFYGVQNINGGVLGSKALLHTTVGLNHRYQVWSGILEKECRSVFEQIKIHQLK